MKITRPPDELAARRELRAWQRAADHLNRAGFAACVPCTLAATLRRRGLDVWCQPRRRVA